MDILDHDYSDLARSTKLCSLKSLHDYYDLLLIRKILSPAQNVVSHVLT